MTTPTKRTKNSRLRGAAEPSAVSSPPSAAEVPPALPTLPAPPTEGLAQVPVSEAPPPATALPPGIDPHLVSMAFKPPAEAPPPTIEEVAAVQQQSPVEDPQIAGTPFRMNDVVQVNDPSSRHYGCFFVVADARHGKLHGWYMMEGLKKEFLTVPFGTVHYIGSAKVRTRVGTSPKWQSDNR